jgi:predicted metal-binding membrane protein
MTDSSSLEGLLRRDRLVVLIGLGAITFLSWVYLFSLAADMGDMGGEMAMDMAAPRIEPWSAGDFWLMFVMWSVMMVAMMVPSAAPLVLVYARVHRRENEAGRPFASTGVFATGYLIAWTVFSLVATTLQWGLERAALLSPMMISTSRWLGAGLLLAAGVYQLTPLKHACLEHCRSPLSFITHHWRTGAMGALRMGIEHGLFCVGCCWFLMGLLFVGGVMNLLWVAVIAAFVLLEKVAPAGGLVARLSGLLLLAAGLWLAAGGL